MLALLANVVVLRLLPLLPYLPFFQDPEPPVTIDLSSLLAQLLSLGGFAALLAAVINALKRFGVIKDGQAPAASLIGNVLGLAVLVVLRLFAPQIDIVAADSTLETVAQFLVYGLALVAQLGITKTANVALRGTPVVGYTHSGSEATPKSA